MTDNQIAYHDSGFDEWTQVSLPFAGDVKELMRIGMNIIVYSENGNKKAISRDGGQTWKSYQERRKFRRYKRK